MATLRSPQLEKDSVEEVEKQLDRYVMQRHVILETPAVVNLADILKDLPDIDDDSTVDLVMDNCRDYYFRECTWLMAIRYNRLERMLCSNLLCDVPERLYRFFWIDGLVYLAQHHRWSCLEALLARGNGGVCWIDLEKEMVSSFKDHETAVMVFDMMLARCVKLNCPCLKNYEDSWARCGLHQFKMMVNSKNNALRQIVLFDLEHLVHNFLDGQRMSPPSRSVLNGGLIVACEAGLFTAKTFTIENPRVPYLLHTPMSRAVTLNQPDVVCFLYHAGATSNRELFHLSRHPNLKARTQAHPAYVPLLPNINREYPTLDDVDAANKIQGFLTRVASTSRSLKSLFLLQASRHLGWGHGRESRIEQLDIVYTLKKDLEFKDQKVLLKYPSQE